MIRSIERSWVLFLGCLTNCLAYGTSSRLTTGTAFGYAFASAHAWSIRGNSFGRHIVCKLYNFRFRICFGVCEGEARGWFLASMGLDTYYTIWEGNGNGCASNGKKYQMRLVEYCDSMTSLARLKPKPAHERS